MLRTSIDEMTDEMLLGLKRDFQTPFFKSPAYVMLEWDKHLGA